MRFRYFSGDGKSEPEASRFVMGSGLVGSVEAVENMFNGLLGDGVSQVSHARSMCAAQLPRAVWPKEALVWAIRPA